MLLRFVFNLPVVYDNNVSCKIPAGSAEAMGRILDPKHYLPSFGAKMWPHAKDFIYTWQGWWLVLIFSNVVTICV